MFNTTLIKKLIQKTLTFCGNIGINATEKNIFPLLNDEKFIVLNKERIDRITKNNLYFYECLKKIINIKLHKHKLFSTIIIKNKDIQSVIKHIKDNSNKSNHLFYYTPSFAFDYIAVDTYFDLNSKKNTIRISIGDVEKDTIEKFIDYMKGLNYDKI